MRGSALSLQQVGHHRQCPCSHCVQGQWCCCVNSVGCAHVLLLLVCGQAASGNGGGISASVAGDMELTARDTTFSNNSAVSGGAVFLSGPTNGVAVGHFHCDTCTLKDNSALSKVGQGFPWLLQHQLLPSHAHVVTSATCQQAQRLAAGGCLASAVCPLYVHQSPTLNIRRVLHCCACCVQTASMDLGGGGLMATGNVEVQLTGSTAEGNTATSGPGGALHCLQCNSLSLHDCEMRSNAASGPGGAACCEGCEHVSVKSTETEHNTATAGAGLYLSLSPARAADNKGELGVFDSSFHNNTAGRTASGAVAGAGDAPAAQQDGTVGAGGGVFVKSPMPFTVSGSRFTSNHAASGHGGGLWMLCKHVCASGVCYKYSRCYATRITYAAWLCFATCIASA